jgi:hypothetical protein
MAARASSLSSANIASRGGLPSRKRATIAGAAYSKPNAGDERVGVGELREREVRLGWKAEIRLCE